MIQNGKIILDLEKLFLTSVLYLDIEDLEKVIKYKKENGRTTLKLTTSINLSQDDYSKLKNSNVLIKRI